MGAFEALTVSSHRLCRWYLTKNNFHIISDARDVKVIDGNTEGH